MPHVGLSDKEVEERYPSLQVADDVELEDLTRLEDDRLYNVGMQVVQQILHEIAVAGRTKRAGPTIPEEATTQAPAATPAAQSGKAATPDTTTTTTTPAASATNVRHRWSNLSSSPVARQGPCISAVQQQCRSQFKDDAGKDWRTPLRSMRRGSAATELEAPQDPSNAKLYWATDPRTGRLQP